MATIVALWAACCAGLYVQLRDAMTIDAVIAKAEAFPEQPVLLRANIVALVLLSFFLVVKAIFRLFYATDPMEVTWTFVSGFFGQEKQRGIKVDSWITEYNRLHNDKESRATRSGEWARFVGLFQGCTGLWTAGCWLAHRLHQLKASTTNDLAVVEDFVEDNISSCVEEREGNYAKLVNAYYELATLFYEWGWGASFHFADRWRGESFSDSIKRHEYYLAGRLGVKRGDKVLDCGCGIGGPYRNIARFTGADITGITINEYQVKRGNEINKQMGMDKQCRSIQGDFMKLPFGEASFDGVYAIEATCHAPQREGVYSEIYRVLKPGAVFACYEWCLTDKYDPTNEQHRTIKKQIEEGDGLPDMITPDKVDAALKASGFELLETRDAAREPNPGGIPWYQPLTPSWNVFTQRFQFNWLGIRLTKAMLWVMELLHLAPAGTYKVQGMLQQGGMGCAQGGLTGTFTPMYLAVCRKPLS